MSELENKEKILSVKNLQVNFRSDHGLVHAVRGVSFDLYKGETLCIVGESGSGKSVTSKTIMGILPANAVISDGQVIFEGEDLVRVSEEDFHRIRGNKIGMIFQDPLSALNPLIKIGKQITETTLLNSNILKRKYNEIISNDLTALRNLKANRDYELTKINNDVTDYKNTLKRLNEVNKKLAKKESEELLNEKNELLSKVDEYVSSFNRNIKNIINDLNEKKVRNSNREDQLKQINKDTMSEVELNLRIAKRKLRNDGIEKELKLINDFSFKNIDHVEALKLIINYNLSKEKIVKESYKAQRPGLAKILKLKKKEAHGIVNNYHHDLINIKKAKLDVLNKLLKDKETEFNIYKESLDKEVLNKYLMILKENERLTKEKEKRDRRFKENSISKTSKETLVLKTIEDAKFNKYIEDIKEIKKQIYDVYEEYISKTKITRKEAKRRALEVMKEVGIPLPERRFKQYAFEFSGGMRQRIVIAIALTANPEVLICDEPTTALDVTIQAQILELINKLKKERNLSCIFITHDLGVVANMADRVAVMYAGKIVEYGLVNEIFFEPKHPYTWALLSSIPDVDSKEKLEAIPGTPPDMVHPPVGDAFALRSKYAMAIDFKYEPPYFKVSDTHYAATWLLYPGAPKVEMPQIVKTRIANALKGYNKKDFSKEEE